MLEKLLHFISDPQNDYAQHSLDYLELCALVIALALVISLPLGIVGARRPVIAFLATNVSGLARSIPSLAFLAAALPYLGVGFRPSVIALTILGIPPMLLNTIAGLQGVD